MTYVLKTRAITGKLVPLNGEHHEYDRFKVALNIAQLVSDLTGDAIYILDFARDVVVGFSGPAVQRAA